MSRLPIPTLHTSGRPSATAEAVTLWRALEMRRRPTQRIVSDPFAAHLLTLGGRVLLETTRFSAPLLRIAGRGSLAGVWTHVLCRHRLIDDLLHAALRNGVEQVVILGAGYDSRAYRFVDELAGRSVYELDLPPASRRKAAIVAGHPVVFGPPRVRRVEIDFRTQSLADRLAGTGFVVGAPTFVVWEGVAPYLSREAVVSTLSALYGLCGAGSTLTTDLWDGVGGPGRTAPLRRLASRSVSLVGEPLTFGMPMTQVGAFLDEHGWAVTDLLDSGALADRYATDGRRCEPSVYVLAAAYAQYL